MSVSKKPSPVKMGPRKIGDTSKLDKAYRLLASQYTSIASANGHRVRVSDPQVNIKDSSQAVVEVVYCLSDWLYKGPAENPKSSPKTKRIDILVQSTEKYVRDTDFQLTNSCVRVAYCNHGQKHDEVQTVLALHFDFDSKVDSAHPIFHVQHGPYDFPPLILDSIGFRKKIIPSSVATMPSIRIPTAHMGLVSVLLLLAADHLALKPFNVFKGFVEKNDLSKWSVACSEVRALTEKVGINFQSHHWYTNVVGPEKPLPADQAGIGRGRGMS